MGDFNDVLNNNPADERGNGKGGNERLSKDEYAAKKKDERDKLFTLADETAISAAGDGAKFQQFLDTQATFERYSTVNALLIMAQKPEATKLGDFDYWKDKGGSVKKGQTGISILAPGREYTREDGSLAQGYDVKKVFDVSQVDTRKIKPAPTPTTPKFTERHIIAALVTKAPMKITGVDSLPNGGGAATNPETGEISVQKGMSFYDNFRAITHELACAEVINAETSAAHEHGEHTEQSETAEHTAAEPVEVNRADPQFTAYCASYMLCKKYGVDTKDYNFDNAPAQFADMDAQGVKRELTGIRDAAGNVAARVDRDLDALVKAAAAKDKEARNGEDAR